jgi:hypothetical protein
VSSLSGACSPTGYLRQVIAKLGKGGDEGAVGRQYPSAASAPSKCMLWRTSMLEISTERPTRTYGSPSSTTVVMASRRTLERKRRAAVRPGWAAWQ